MTQTSELATRDLHSAVAGDDGAISIWLEFPGGTIVGVRMTLDKFLQRGQPRSRDLHQILCCHFLLIACSIVSPCIHRKPSRRPSLRYGSGP